MLLVPERPLREDVEPIYEWQHQEPWARIQLHRQTPGRYGIYVHHSGESPVLMHWPVLQAAGCVQVLQGLVSAGLAALYHQGDDAAGGSSACAYRRMHFLAPKLCSVKHCTPRLFYRALGLLCWLQTHLIPSVVSWSKMRFSWCLHMQAVNATLCQAWDSVHGFGTHMGGDIW